MKFICDRHREIYASDPQAALQFWNRSLALARQKVLHAQWGEASVIYGNAFEAAEILLGADVCNKRALTRYLQTAEEFAYALRKNTCINEVGLLITSVRNRLAPVLPPEQVESRMRALQANAVRHGQEGAGAIELALVMELGRSQTFH